MESLKRFIKGSAILWLIVIVVLVLAFLWFAKLQFSWYYPAVAIFLIAVAGLIKYVATGGGDKYFRMLSVILMAVVFGILLNVGAFSGLLPVNVNISDLVLRNLAVTDTVDLNKVNAKDVNVDTVTAKVVNVEEVNVDDIDSYKKSEITVKAPVTFKEKVTYEKGVDIKGGLTVDTATFGAVYIEDLQVDKAKINDLTVVEFSGPCTSNNNNSNNNNNNSINNNKPKPEQPQPRPEQPQPRPEQPQPRPEQPQPRPEPRPEQPEQPQPKPEMATAKINFADIAGSPECIYASVVIYGDASNVSIKSATHVAHPESRGNGVWYVTIPIDAGDQICDLTVTGENLLTVSSSINIK